MRSSSEVRGFAACRGFTLLELALVVLIAGLLIAGMGILIDIPRDVLLRQSGQSSSLSSAQMVLAQIEKDTRYASDVQVHGPQLMVARTAAGASVTYRFSGDSGGSLLRSDPSGSIRLLDSLDSFQFRFGITRLEVQNSIARGLARCLRTHGFDGPTLEAGYVFAGGASSGGRPVRVFHPMQTIGQGRRAAVVFSSGSVGDSALLPALVSLRLKRLSTGSLVVELFESNSDRPDRFLPVASGSVDSEALPRSLGNVGIPLTASRRLRGGTSYFIEIREEPAGSLPASMEFTVLDRTGAGADVGTRALVSEDGGATYRPLTPGAGECASVFSLKCRRSYAAEADGFVSIELATTLEVSLGFSLESGAESIQMAFPLENNVARAQQLRADGR